jgi:hypothetical protein
MVPVGFIVVFLLLLWFYDSRDRATRIRQEQAELQELVQRVNKLVSAREMNDFAGWVSAVRALELRTAHLVYEAARARTEHLRWSR